MSQYFQYFGVLKALDSINKKRKIDGIDVPERDGKERFFFQYGNTISESIWGNTREEVYELAKDYGDIDIVIGPRSALFVPFNKLGLIIIDEEHEDSYKSETPPKYDSRAVAIKRADLTNSSVILGSATPSINSYKQALDGKYKLYKLTERVGGGTLPNVSIIDLREELKQKNTSIFSGRLE